VTGEPPRYLTLADELAGDITHLVPGDRLPSEVELAQRHDVSRLTARAAVQELEQRYLVRRTKGSGTYVAHRIDYVVSPRFVPWTEMVQRAGAATSRPVVSSTVIRAPEEVCHGLELESASRVVKLVRLGTVDELTANITYSYLPRDLAPGFAEMLVSGGSDLVPVLRALGYTPRRSWAYAEMEVPDAETA
jgi:GntR family transcriptional regulator